MNDSDTPFRGVLGRRDTRQALELPDEVRVITEARVKGHRSQGPRRQTPDFPHRAAKPLHAGESLGGEADREVEGPLQSPLARAQSLRRR